MLMEDRQATRQFKYLYLIVYQGDTDEVVFHFKYLSLILFLKIIIQKYFLVFFSETRELYSDEHIFFPIFFSRPIVLQNTLIS